MEVLCDDWAILSATGYTPSLTRGIAVEPSRALAVALSRHYCNFLIRNGPRRPVSSCFEITGERGALKDRDRS